MRLVAFTMPGIALVVGSAKSVWLLVTVAVFMPFAAVFVWITAQVEDAEPEAESVPQNR